MSKLCFVTCLDEGYVLGLYGLVRSIRKFYAPQKADIVAFFAQPNAAVQAFCQAQTVELQYFKAIDAWRQVLLNEPRFLDDKKHFYHADFEVPPGLPRQLNRDLSLGINRVHHLHPFNAKAHATAYCGCVRKDKRIVYIDADAFLLAPIDSIFEALPDSTVIGCDDGPDDLPHLEALYGVTRPADLDAALYGFNAGVVFYTNGAGVRELLKDFSFYIDSCYHYDYSGNYADQGVLRALVAKHHLLGNITFRQQPRVNWNPTWHHADRMHLDNDKQQWINEANGQRQFIWHGAGTDKVWRGRYPWPAVATAWKWVGGATEPLAYTRVRGSCGEEKCVALAQTIAEHFAGRDNKTLRILEIGTQYGRTAIAMHTLLAARGYDAHVDTFDIYAPSPYYPIEYATFTEAQRSIEEFGLKDKITLHNVEACADISAHISVPPDVIFIDGDHRYKQVVADCFIARRLLATNGLIIGDDFDFPSVREAVHAVFGPSRVTVLCANQMWAVTMRRPV